MQWIWDYRRPWQAAGFTHPALSEPAMSSRHVYGCTSVSLGFVIVATASEAWNPNPLLPSTVKKEVKLNNQKLSFNSFCPWIFLHMFHPVFLFYNSAIYSVLKTTLSVATRTHTERRISPHSVYSNTSRWRQAVSFLFIELQTTDH